MDFREPTEGMVQLSSWRVSCPGTLAVPPPHMPSRAMNIASVDHPLVLNSGFTFVRVCGDGVGLQGWLAS